MAINLFGGMCGFWRRSVLLLVVLGFSSLGWAQTQWTERHQQVGGSFLWGIAEGNGGVVAVGTGGRILHSVDGKSWATVSSGTSVWLVAVCGGAGDFVAVGDGGTILRSATGTTWTRAKLVPTTARLNNVIYSDGLYVAVGEGGVILYSTDGDTWVETPSGVTGWLRALTRVGGIWVAGGQKGPLSLSTDGKVWNTAPAFSFDVEAFAFNPAFAASNEYARFYMCQYVGEKGAIGDVALNIQYGRPTWFTLPRLNTSQSGGDARLRAISNLNGVVVATGENGEAYITSKTLYSSYSYAGLALPTTANLVGSGVALGSLWLVGADETILQSETIAVTRLVNISTRGVSGKYRLPMVAGTVVTGDKPRQFLVRAVGPGLASFGVGKTLTFAQLDVFRSDGSLLAKNFRWATLPNPAAVEELATKVGAFSLDVNRHDSALAITLSPGNYTFQLTDPFNPLSPGIGLVEVYDTSPEDTSGTHLSNVSTLGWVGEGGDVLIAGFVLKGPASRRVLIRGIGPTLANFSVANTLSDPVIKLYRGNTLLAENDDWGTGGTYLNREVTADEAAADMATAGAFALSRDSKDAAIVVTLMGGNYTLHVEGKNGQTGAGLVEVYELP